jgi:hypothetical protein
MVMVMVVIIIMITKTMIKTVIIAIMQECVTEAINYGKCLQNKHLHNVSRKYPSCMAGDVHVVRDVNGSKGMR